MPPKRRRRFQGLYYHSSPPKVLPMNGQIANSNGRRNRGPDDLSVKLSTIRIWMHEKDIGKLTRVLWAGQGNRLRQQASTNNKVKRFLAAVPYVMNSIKDVHQAVIDNNLENLQANLEPPVPPALVTCRDANGLNLIHKAAGLGHATILEYLITTWPDGVHESDITGKTPLHWAASAKNNMRCYTLLTQAGCDEEAVDYKMKTPSFYRHKPHEIERAFLTYVPETPRVSPDVTTDWEALSDDSGDGKKLDIKIPDMNGFGRHSNAESNENTSEAEMTEATSGHEDEDVTEENDVIAGKDEQHDEEAAEDESQNNNEDERIIEHSAEEKEEEHDEDKEEEEEEEEEEKSEDTNDDQEMPEKKDEPLDEKQQTQTLTATTANLTKEIEDENKIENENMESKEHESGNEMNDSDSDDHKTADTNEQATQEEKANVVFASESSHEISSDKAKEKESNKINHERTIEQDNEKDTKETIDKQAADEKNVISLDETKNEIENFEKAKDILVEENKELDEKKTSGRKKTDEANKPQSPLQTGQENGQSNQENGSKVKGDVKETNQDNEINNQENFTKLKEDGEETGKENYKSSSENVFEVINDEKEKVGNEDQGDSKTLTETLTDIKDEVKDNVQYLANQIKNVFSDKDSKEDEQGKDQIIAKEISDSKEDTKMKETNNAEHESKEIEKGNDEKLQDKTTTSDKDQEDEHEKPIETKEHDNLTEAHARDDKNKETPEKHDADKQENQIQNEEIKQESENNKDNLQELTNASSNNSDAQREDSDNSNKTVEPQTETKTDVSTTSSSNANSSNENTPSDIQTSTQTDPKTSAKESPKKNNDKTEEDENNNNSKLANELDTTASKQTEAITDEQFKEIDKSLEEYKKAEKSSLPETEKDIGIKLEEMADNLKENVKEMASKVMNVFSTANVSQSEAEKLETESNDVVLHTESPQKQMSGKKSAKQGESSDDTADEDEESQAEAGNEENDKKAEETDNEEILENEATAELDQDAPTEPVTQDNNEDKLADGAQNGEGSTTSSLAFEGFVQGDAEDNTVQSQTAAYDDDDYDEETRLQSIIGAGDMEQLAQIVLNGDGQKLLNVVATEPEIQAFLRNVPNYMGKIRRVHEAARQGSLLNLQQALDRRKFAIAKDEVSPNGATPLHVAVVFGNSDIVRYLSARFPETTTITDNDGRTALHYAAVINDNGHFYNVLLQLGANPKVIDKMCHTPEDYLNKKELNDIFNYNQLLKSFGAENLDEHILNDQGRIENQSIQENPLFKTEQGKYLADNLADPLIKALTQVAQKRPNDPLQYLANYLQNYVTSRNTNGRTITQVAVHSGSSKTDSTILVSAKQPTPSDTQIQRQNAHMNGHIKYDTTNSIEEDAMQKLEEFTDDDDGGNDSDATMAKKLEDRDEHGQSLLHFSCARSHRKGSLIRVIAESKADITYRDELYRTPRDVALQANQFANAKEIDHYVMSLAIVGDIKPFEYFAISGYDHIIDVLDDNETPIIEVVEASGLHELAEYLKTIRPLEELREELHQMIRDNNVDRVKEIADGPNGKWVIKAKNYYGRTALHIAILKESIEIVEHFVNRCPEALKIGDNLERTALHYAMGTNIIESISRILIQNGAKRTYKDLKGRQPSYYFMNKADILRLQEEEDESR